MGNLIAILVHCNRGHEMIVGDRTHIFLDEAGGYSALGGVHPFPLPNQPDGTIDLDKIQESIWSDDDPHHSPTQLITLENTHNACGGRVLGVDYTRVVFEIALITGAAQGIGRTPGDPKLEEFLEPEDVAEAVIFAVTQPPKSRIFLIGMRPMCESLFD